MQWLKYGFPIILILLLGCAPNGENVATHSAPVAKMLTDVVAATATLPPPDVSFANDEVAAAEFGC